MPTLITQAHRGVVVKTPLGNDVLLLAHMIGQECLSQLFRFDLDLYSEQPDKVDSDQILGQNVTIRFGHKPEMCRYFNGFVSSFEILADPNKPVCYRASVVPWLWFLTRTSNCRIFQQMTVPNIIKQVFRDQGFSNLEESLTRDYRTCDYCVQYRETDFNFVSRLMEQEGIYYYFKHEEDKHTLVLCDSVSAHEPYPDYEEIRFLPSSGSRTEREFIRSCGMGYQVQPGVCVLNNYDFTNPKKPMEVRTKAKRDHAASEYEMYDYPGEYVEYSDGESYSKIRLNELQSKYEVIRGSSDAKGIHAGYTFKLSGHPFSKLNRKYLITSSTYDIKSNIDSLFGASDGREAWKLGFTAIDQEQQFRPPRSTPKPVIQGPQTAIVVGLEGEEIYTDKYGRVKVQFHWDREGNMDANSSCWVRTAQLWAGQKWGAMYIPRVGQEVIIEFLEGNPDRPIVTGRVYNGDQMPPYALPDEKTKSTLKSNSSLDGGGSNEIRFEDKAGEEEIYIHAQKDQDIVVENDRTESVGSSETVKVALTRTHFVGINDMLNVGGARQVNVGGLQTIVVGLVQAIVVGLTQRIIVGGKQRTRVRKDNSLKVGKSQDITVKKDQATSIGKNNSLTVGESQDITVGKSQTTNIEEDDTLTVGKTLTIDVGEQIMIKTGDASLLMKKDGTILIKGKDITIDGSGKVNVKAKKDVIIKGKGVKGN